MEADAAQYIPLLHKNWVLAVRGRMAMSETGAGQEVPFYLLPALGGPTTLRGFSNYRFRDRNLLLVNAEYRWPIFRALDGALFYDAGTVTAQSLTLHHPHTDYGAGVRLHSTTRTLVPPRHPSAPAPLGTPEPGWNTARRRYRNISIAISSSYSPAILTCRAKRPHGTKPTRA